MNKRSDNLLILGLLGIMVLVGLYFALPALGGSAAGSGDGGSSISVADSDRGTSSTSSPGEDDSLSSDWDSTAENDVDFTSAPPTIDATIATVDLPVEALDTMFLIEQGGPYPYSKDGSVFQNREGLLPDHDIGWYREYTVDTPGSSDRGARRIVGGEDGVLYWTDDHYGSFAEIRSDE